jgi:hypothetical protein
MGSMSYQKGFKKSMAVVTELNFKKLKQVLAPLGQSLQWYC